MICTRSPFGRDAAEVSLAAVCDILFRFGSIPYEVVRHLFEREAGSLFSVKNFYFSAFSVNPFLTDLQKPEQKNAPSPLVTRGHENTTDSAPVSNGVRRKGCRRG